MKRILLACACLMHTVWPMEERPAKRVKLSENYLRQEVPTLEDYSAKALSNILKVDAITAEYHADLVAIEEELPWPLLPKLKRAVCPQELANSALIKVSTPVILKTKSFRCPKYNLSFSMFGTTISGSCDEQRNFEWDMVSDQIRFFVHRNPILSFTSKYEIRHSSNRQNARLDDLDGSTSIELHDSGHLIFYSETFSLDETLLVSSHDTEIRIWDTSTGKCIKCLTGFYNAANKRCAFSHDNSKLVIADPDELIVIQFYNPDLNQYPKTLIDACFLRFIYTHHENIHLCANPELKSWFDGLNTHMKEYIRRFLPECPSDCHNWWKVLGYYTKLRQSGNLCNIKQMQTLSQ